MPPLPQSLMVDAAKSRFRAFARALPSVAATGNPPDVARFLLATPVTAPPAGTIAPRPVAGSPLGTGLSATSALGVRGLATQPLSAGAALTPGPTLATATPQGVPPALVKAASSAAADVAFQATVSDELSRTIDAVCTAVVSAHNAWRQQAFLSGVQVTAATASGGFVRGPGLGMLIRAQLQPTLLFGTGATLGAAVADGLDASWRDWQASVTVPGLSWWPTFVAVPAPMAPPTPNVPTPLAALSWGPSTITADALTLSMQSRLATPVPFGAELVASIAAGISQALALWFPSQLVSNVLATGPVPTFAPPYVPVGAVVGGTIIERPPHFSP